MLDGFQRRAIGRAVEGLLSWGNLNRDDVILKAVEIAEARSGRRFESTAWTEAVAYAKRLTKEWGV